MRAVVVQGFGGPSEARIADMPMPHCGANDVLVRVVAAGVNPADWKESEGNLAQFFPNYPDMWIPGLDVAGVVDSVGADVSRFKPGDRVVGFSDRSRGHAGTFAEYVRIPQDMMAIVPPSITLEEASALPTAAVTGYQALVKPDKAGLGRGDSVFIHGASGGVGSYTGQLAKALGVRVAASCRARSIDYVRSLGAGLVLDPAAGDLVEAIQRWQAGGVDAVIDCVSGSSFSDALGALRPGGKLISIATLTQDGDVQGDIEKAAELGFTKVFAFVAYEGFGDDLAEILALMEKGAVKTPPLTSYPLDSAPEALQHMKDGGIRGKIILTVSNADGRRM